MFKFLQRKTEKKDLSLEKAKDHLREMVAFALSLANVIPNTANKDLKKQAKEVKDLCGELYIHLKSDTAENLLQCYFKSNLLKEMLDKLVDLIADDAGEIYKKPQKRGRKAKTTK